MLAIKVTCLVIFNWCIFSNWIIKNIDIWCILRFWFGFQCQRRLIISNISFCCFSREKSFQRFSHKFKDRTFSLLFLLILILLYMLRKRSSLTKCIFDFWFFDNFRCLNWTKPRQVWLSRSCLTFVQDIRTCLRIFKWRDSYIWFLADWRFTSFWDFFFKLKFWKMSKLRWRCLLSLMLDIPWAGNPLSFFDLISSNYLK